MKNNTPFLFSIYSLIVIRTIFAIRRTNFLTVWIILELNILRFIPIIKNSKWNQETEAATKYFLAQALGSLLLLLSSTLIHYSRYYILSIFCSATFTTSILLKLGGAPCHIWYPSVIAAISWKNCLILSTWQKLAPLSLLLFINEVNKTNTLLLLIAGINTIVGGIIGINQTNLRSLLAYSSIGHIGWILSIIRINKIYIAIIYFLIYSILVSPVFLLLNYINTITIQDMTSSSKSNILITPIISILLISLAGLPPLAGFLPKLIVIYNIISINYFIIFILLLGSYINLYYYLNISLSSILSSVPNRTNPTKPVSASTTVTLLITLSILIIGFITLL